MGLEPAVALIGASSESPAVTLQNESQKTSLVSCIEAF